MEATGCSVIIPDGFVLSDNEGVFLNEHYPLETGIITYTVTETGSGEVLTNSERENMPEETEVDSATELTQEFYLETMQAAMNEKYGTDVGYQILEFDNIKIDEYPGYFIDASYQKDEQTIHQMIYIIISKYKTFTIIYSQASDDDFTQVFEESASSIHVY
ncbi:MAG: DUF1795 domain-containing protein [Butyrivibrio sp.]|nr:DUF1795 domain-containing protein [Butyrivibrio sp.]